jgi:hypothetical protein
MPGLRQSSAQTLTPRKSGRARVPARREDVCNLRVYFCPRSYTSSASVTTDHEDAIPPGDALSTTS